MNVEGVMRLIPVVTSKLCVKGVLPLLGGLIRNLICGRLSSSRNDLLRSASAERNDCFEDDKDIVDNGRNSVSSVDGEKGIVVAREGLIFNLDPPSKDDESSSGPVVAADESLYDFDEMSGLLVNLRLVHSTCDFVPYK